MDLSCSPLVYGSVRSLLIRRGPPARLRTARTTGASVRRNQCGTSRAVCGRHTTGRMPESPRPRPARSPVVRLGRQGRDERQIPVPLRVIQAVADDELPRQVEANVPDVDVSDPGIGLAHQREDLDGRRAARAQVRNQPREGEAGVDNVLDDEDVAALNALVEILQDPYDA